MAQKSVIHQRGAGPRVLLLAAGGKSSRQIADQLAKEGIKLSHVAVQKYLKQHSEEHAEATENVRAAVETKVLGQALDDVQMLEELRNELRRVVFEDKPQAIGMYGPLTADNPVTGEKVPVVDQSLWLKSAKELRDTLALRLKIAGATRPDGEGTNKPSAYANVADLSDEELEELIRDDKKPGPGP